MRDVTVLRQIAAHLDGWSNLRARVATDEVSWPSVHLSGGPGAGSQLWQCVRDCWTGQLFEGPDAVGEPVATVHTAIGEDASASEVSDGIKAIYRLLGTGPGPGD
jgi:hypothetical protein